MNDTSYDDGQVTTGTAVDILDQGTLSTLARAEIDTQIATARRFPRSIPAVVNQIKSLVVIDDETAAECCYALVRGKKNRGRNGAEEEENKPIEGPSIRLAEVAAQMYGNCRISARVIEVNRNEKYVEAEGTFLDLQTNMASKATVRRRISTRNGQVFSDDMILVTSNAACAIAKRNAILAGIPRAVYRPAYLAARQVIAGTVETLQKNRDNALKAFASFGVKPEQLLAGLDLEHVSEITVDHVATLRAMYQTIKNGEATVEEMFSKASGAEHAKIENPLDDRIPHDGSADAGSSAGSKEGYGDDGAAMAADSSPGPDAAGSSLTPREQGRAAYHAGVSRRKIPDGIKGTDDEPEYIAGFDEAASENDFPGDR